VSEPHPDAPGEPGQLNSPDPDRVREDLAELADLVAIGIEVDGQVIQVAESTWAIYGHASYDGQIIVGEYPDAGEASEVLRAVPHPEQFRLDELVRRGLHSRHDPRQVIADSQARYFGAELGEHTLGPDDGALLAETPFED
jgi:hypothetical protein